MAKGFLPNPGDIVGYEEPGGLGVRVDSGVRAGSAISQYYDNLIAKLVVWGRDRTEAIERSRRALSEFAITGVVADRYADHVSLQLTVRGMEDRRDAIARACEHPAAPKAKRMPPPDRSLLVPVVAEPASCGRTWTRASAGSRV